jgi:heavy metal translocating P-type ATPase
MSRFRLLVALLSAFGLAAGFLAPYLGLGEWQRLVWGAAAGIVLLNLVSDFWASMHRGEFGLDILAGISMSVAIGFGETLAAAIVALMYSGGQLLENFAETRAQSEMKALLERAPKRALRYDDGHLIDVDIDALLPGDRILVRQGETVPADGKLVSDKALLDLSMLTGESVPVLCRAGGDMRSGSSSIDMAFDMAVTRRAADSTFSGIVRLVQAAQKAKAPMVRLADRIALWFLAIALSIAGSAWIFTGDHLRMLAVLVSATPCPLILAVPVAIISGISRAARRGVLLKGGPVLETLARASILVIDKTGTLTEGRAGLQRIDAYGGFSSDDVLRFAASLDQASGHVIAASIVQAARARRLQLDVPARAKEEAGSGIEGRVNGRKVLVGGHDYVRKNLPRRTLRKPSLAPGSVSVAVAIDGKFAGYLTLADTLRPDAAQTLSRLREAGIKRIVLASGDQSAVVTAIGGQLKLDQVRSRLSPGEKVDVVLAERSHGVVLMAGDGVNDAPALAAADVGISMGVRGSPASAEAADAVLLVDNLERVAEAMTISKRARRIALQSVNLGIGFSVAAMLAGAFGYITVVEGALVQEAIDVAVILNALRALR